MKIILLKSPIMVILSGTKKVVPLSRFSEKKYMSKKLKLIISLLLMLLWSWYYVSTQCFTHTHFVNSQLITHSHPYQNPHHQHSSASFLLIKALSTSLLVAPDFAFTAAVVMTILAVLAYASTAADFTQNCWKCSLLRAPPAC